MSCGAVSGVGLAGSDNAQVHQGWVSYYNIQAGSWSPAWCMLKDERLVLYASPNTDQFHFALKMNPSCRLRYEKDSASEHTFHVLRDQRTLISLQVKTPQERDSWITRLKEYVSVVETVQRHQRTRSEDTGDDHHQPSSPPLPPPPSSSSPSPSSSAAPQLHPPPQRRHSEPLPPPRDLPALPRANLPLPLPPCQSPFPPPPDEEAPDPSYLTPTWEKAEGGDARGEGGGGDPSSSSSSALPLLHPPRTCSFHIDADQFPANWSLKPVPDYLKLVDEPEGGGIGTNQGDRGAMSFKSQTSRDSGYNTSGGSCHPEVDQPKTPLPTDHKQPGKIFPWFFDDCTREKAERVLLTCNPQMGNTLMRGHSDTSTYFSISKRCKQGSECRVHHYQVLRDKDWRGYRIAAENTNVVFPNLEEVMKAFVKASGPRTTIPMKTNNEDILGVSGLRADPGSRNQQPPPLPRRA